MTKLREKAEEYGRDPAGLSCTTVVALFSLAEVPERGRRPYTGSIPQVIQDLAALAEAGVDEVILTLPFLAGSVPELADLAATFRQQILEAGI
jgi:hypothetical protein